MVLMAIPAILSYNLFTHICIRNVVTIYIISPQQKDCHSSNCATKFGCQKVFVPKNPSWVWKNQQHNNHLLKILGARSLSHTIHGTGVFTYMNGWFLWFSCRKIYQTRPMDCLGGAFWDKPTPTTRSPSSLQMSTFRGTNCSCWMSIASGGWIADIFVLHLGGQRRWHLVESRFGPVFSKRWKPAFNAFSMLVAKIQHKLGGIEATIVWMFFWETLILKRSLHQTWDDNWRPQIRCSCNISISVYLLTGFEVKKVEHLCV